MTNHSFRFNEIASKVMDWNPEQSDVLENVVTDANLLRFGDNDSYRGSKQKSPAFMECMIEMCTGKGSAVIDLRAGVGEHHPNIPVLVMFEWAQRSMVLELIHVLIQTRVMCPSMRTEREKRTRDGGGWIYVRHVSQRHCCCTLG